MYIWVSIKNPYTPRYKISENKELKDNLTSCQKVYEYIYFDKKIPAE